MTPDLDPIRRDLIVRIIPETAAVFFLGSLGFTKSNPSVHESVKPAERLTECWLGPGDFIGADGFLHHTVLEGENLSLISSAHGTQIENINKLNDIKPTSLLHTGRDLILSGSSCPQGIDSIPIETSGIIGNLFRPEERRSLLEKVKYDHSYGGSWVPSQIARIEATVVRTAEALLSIGVQKSIILGKEVTFAKERKDRVPNVWDRHIALAPEDIEVYSPYLYVASFFSTDMRGLTQSIAAYVQQATLYGRNIRCLTPTTDAVFEYCRGGKKMAELDTQILPGVVAYLAERIALWEMQNQHDASLNEVRLWIEEKYGQNGWGKLGGAFPSEQIKK